MKNPEPTVSSPSSLPAVMPNMGRTLAGGGWVGADAVRAVLGEASGRGEGGSAKQERREWVGNQGGECEMR